MKFLISLLVVLFGTGTALADTSTPEGVVTEMYQTYFDALNASNAKQSGDPAAMPSVFDQVPKYATPELSARMKKAEKSEDMVIDWDFLVNGQDFQDLKLISVSKTTGDDKTASVRAKTSNMGTESDTDVSLVKTDAGWKISDFTFFPGQPEQTTLDQILKDAGY